ncbi:MAG: glycosyltransferase family 4 protein, partial [Armatimonadetes bacterium]|nr:glycosyltransferase family 4 protein [Armatimonadota bacterium]
LLAIAEPYALACGPATRRRPVAVCACGTYVPLTCEIGTFRHFYRRAYQRCHLTAISRYTAGRVAEWLPAPVRVITPGVDFQRYQPGGQPPLDPGPWVVTAGGVKSRKGTAVLVSAMAEVVKQVPNARLAVIGTLPEDEYASRVKQSIAENGLAERVTLTGHIPFEELLGYYHAATAFALPSVSLPQRFEGFGLVLLEAQAAGAPAVGARDCGNEDALLPGQTGFLMEQHNHEELAGHLVTLLTDTELRQRMSAAAREYARSRDWSRVGAEYLAWFEEAIAAGPA